jgi:hypothetical protein
MTSIMAMNERTPGSKSDTIAEEEYCGKKFALTATDNGPQNLWRRSGSN